MITHLEPDILECEVKWSLESITTNKASGRDGIPADLFQIVNPVAPGVEHFVLDTSLDDVAAGDPSWAAVLKHPACWP